MKYKHLLSSDEKLKHWKCGEWIEEPDLVEFIHLNLKCKVKRMFIQESDESLFGGYLCGYVHIPKNSPWTKLNFENFHEIELPLDIHGGITYYQQGEDGFWIGFDCAHSFDLIPSLQVFRKKYKNEKWVKDHENLKSRFPNSFLFNPTYKNINFVIQQCKSLAEQLFKKTRINE